MKNRIEMRYDFRMSAENEKSAEIMVYGAITSDKWCEDDVTAIDFKKQLDKCREKEVEDLHLRINSGGGEVFQAVAIRNMLATCGMNVRVTVEGLCASAATLFATIPGVPVTIAPGSSFMIHNPSTLAWGNADAMEHEAGILRNMEGDFHKMYAEKTGQSEEQIKAWMDAESWFTADQAVEYGFCDSLTESEKAAACVDAALYGVMTETYSHTPTMKISNNDSPTGTAGEPIANNHPETEEQETMETIDMSALTMDMLREENRVLYDAIFNAGAAAERERISAIDDVTPAGYEDMAKEAKDSGTTAAEFAMNVLKAQRMKGAKFINDRAEELKPAKDVKGGAAEDNDTEILDEEKAAKELADAAKDVRENTGMY